MFSLERKVWRRVAWCLLICGAAVMVPKAAAIEQFAEPNADAVRAAMQRATRYMLDRVSTRGGFVWSYLPDLSRRWGELEATPSMIWIQPPGTATMGHLFLDAYHATGDEFYYDAAVRTTRAVIAAQHASGGWHYMFDFDGPASMAQWYSTIGKHAWRLEEFQHDWGNATFDDAGTAESARLLLRMYAEKREGAFKPALDQAIAFVLDSQYPIGAWPQRYPKGVPFEHHGLPDYTGFYTFNDDVAAENIEFLVQVYQALGDRRVLDAITRAMSAFVVMQQGPPQAGWALQYTADLQPSGARTYEPRALATHTTASNIERLLRFHELTGDTRYLARIGEALDWLDRVASPPGVAPPGRTHPTFIEVGTDKPLYVHRTGSNVVNGRYFADDDPAQPLGHYSAFRAVDTKGLRTRLQAALRADHAALRARSPLTLAPGQVPLPRFVAVEPAGTETPRQVIDALTSEGAWIGPLGYNSHPYKGPAPSAVAPGDFAGTHVGDEYDTSPFPDRTIMGVSTALYVRRMSTLIRAVAPPREWLVNNLAQVGGHPVEVVGAPATVSTPEGVVVEFDGVDDGLIVDSNILEGLAAFTLAVDFSPAVGGPEEQRFVHAEERTTGNRALVELRMVDANSFALDTFLKSGDASLTLLDRARVHRAGAWHRAALTFDGATMAHYVDGRLDGTGPVAFKPLGAGRTSIGVRQNRVSHFKGRVRRVVVWPTAVAPGDARLRGPQ